MEVVDNEVWLLLADGRLISMNQHASQAHVAQGNAQVIPPERVVRDGGAFVLLDEDDPRVAEGKAAAEKAAKEKADAEAAAAAEAEEADDEEEEETEEAPATTESAAVAPPESAVAGKPSARKPA
jgi:hypothetical protein